MNDVLEALMLIGILTLSAAWVTAVFCYVIFILGGHDD
jgi:uncharacterized membrane protein YphA (DoxX/SURF4 family)